MGSGNASSIANSDLHGKMENAPFPTRTAGNYRGGNVKKRLRAPDHKLQYLPIPQPRVGSG